MFDRLEARESRHRELEILLQDPDVISNSTRYRAAVKEHGSLAKMVGVYRQFKEVQQALQEAKSIMDEGDEELAEYARGEVEILGKRLEETERRLEDLILAEEEGGDRNAIMEIRAGTGGDEASLFAADLYRMYTKFAERRGWKVDVLEAVRTNLDGLKEAIISVQGDGAFRALQFESGGHRVQRVPKTEAQGRIHTSAATVAVMPEAEEVDVDINPNDIRVDTMRAGGPGGQSVNKTSSAVRMTHIPTGIVVKCQDEKSQHKNRAKALRILRSRLLDKAEREEAEKRGDLRRTLIGSGDRSQRIRTYNFPQNRVTDHRIHLAVHQLENVLAGHLDELVGKLLEHDRKIRLQAKS
ncbi:MAG: peptide chain release factor 1 [Planctomycetota bacterium]|nr:peptide chain release factor 1 [Planctomycetota bacterium]